MPRVTVSLAGNLPALPPGFGSWGLFIPEMPPLSVQIAEAAEYAKRLAEQMERETRARIRGAAYKSRCDKGTVKGSSMPGLMLAVIREHPGLHAREIFQRAGLTGSSSRSGHALTTMVERGLIERRRCPQGLRGGVYFAR